VHLLFSPPSTSSGGGAPDGVVSAMQQVISATLLVHVAFYEAVAATSASADTSLAGPADLRAGHGRVDIHGGRRRHLVVEHALPASAAASLLRREVSLGQRVGPTEEVADGNSNKNKLAPLPYPNFQPMGGPFKNAVACDAVEGYFRCPSRNTSRIPRPTDGFAVKLEPDSPLGTTDFGLSAEIRLNFSTAADASSFGAAAVTTTASHPNLGFHFNSGEFIGLSGTTNTWFVTGGEFGASEIPLSNQAPNSSTWHRVFIQRRQGKVNIYCDGQLVTGASGGVYESGDIDMADTMVDSVQLRTGAVGEVDIKNFCFDCWFWPKVESDFQVTTSPDPNSAAWDEIQRIKAELDAEHNRLIAAEKKACYDAHEDECKTWKDNGECATNSDWMSRFCMKSCDTCQTAEKYSSKDFAAQPAEQIGADPATPTSGD